MQRSDTLEASAGTLGRYAWLWIFGLALGWFEAAAVTFLRVAYYPDGLQFPLAPLPGNLLRVEMAREAASLVLLAAAARLSAQRPLARFAAFMLLFGIWDLVYYAGLWITLDWPSSPSTLDILFLLPEPWIGPVWAPCVVSLALIGAGSWIYCAPERVPRLSALDWCVELAAGALIIASMVAAGRSLERTGGALAQPSSVSFPAWLFWLGMLLGVAWFVRVQVRAVAMPRR